MHRLGGLVWPCRFEAEFDSLWASVQAEMRERGLPLGRESFGGWDDGDPAFTRAVYCLTRALEPATVVETGVGHGVTTRLILEALERNRSGGRLWSVDLPPLLARGLAAEVAAAVPEHMRVRWTLCPGSSRRVLSRLLGRVRTVGVFVHDSLHTGRNVGFELHRAWQALVPGGAAIIDDVDYNQAFHAFATDTADARALVADHADRRGLFGVLLKAN
jgi:predicted O-methyltransferase YrrM